MKTGLSEKINMSVLFCRKVLDNDTELRYRVDMVPVPEEKRCGYLFALELIHGEEIDHEEIFDAVADSHTAEKIFDLLTSNDVLPCHLKDVIEDYISS
ncbi:MAG: hypothetical protein HFE63_08685 [Clostridiales bacterium]|nr:hypothetical protein [Clostridiales bacterium]